MDLGVEPGVGVEVEVGVAGFGKLCFDERCVGVLFAGADPAGAPVIRAPLAVALSEGAFCAGMRFV